MKYLIKFSYDGSKFHGFQRQNNVRNVQSDIENELTKIFDETIQIKGAGRTDAKVHALNQCAHFETNKKIKYVKRKLNQNIKNIKIKKVKIVKDDFHARFSVKEKTYVYKLTQNNKDNKRYYGYYYGNIDYKKIKKGIKLFKGYHNYKNFVAGSRESYESNITYVKTYKINKRIYFIFKGKGFYRYMVRNLVGALIDYAKNKVTYNELKEMLDNYEKEKTLSTAKAEGLYLKKIKY